ncbi:MAG: hypothetical protein LBK18_08355 [Prevotellaceae bacterium]|jgi:hypothetical protein|nr:hypothetical protein [Prevotellaceae bacterium]
MLVRNFYYYLANQDELVKQYNGKYLVISDRKIIYSSPDDADAFKKGMEMAGLGNFIMQLCTPGEQAYTVKCYTPRVVFSDVRNRQKS